MSPEEPFFLPAGTRKRPSLARRLRLLSRLAGGVDQDGVFERLVQAPGQILLRRVLVLAWDLLDLAPVSPDALTREARELTRVALAPLIGAPGADVAAVTRAITAARLTDPSLPARQRRADILARVNQSAGTAVRERALRASIYEQHLEGRVYDVHGRDARTKVLAERAAFLVRSLRDVDPRFETLAPERVAKIVRIHARAGSSNAALAAHLAWRAGLEGSGTGKVPAKVRQLYEAAAVTSEP